MELTYEDSGSQRDLRVGEQVEIRLPESPTTGYRWQADVDLAALKQTHDGFEGGALPRGAAGVRVMRFEALQPGDATLRLVKQRSWERKPTDEFTARLRVLPPG
jgi:inhibitor of cysteine peptidase